jgi:molybdopterin converting factor small subunit
MEGMKIRVRLLKPLSDAVDAPQMDVAVPEGASVRHLLEHLCEQHPALAQNICIAGGAMVDSLVILVNNRPIADTGTSLAAGDEVLLLFPAGGG